MQLVNAWGRVPKAMQTENVARALLLALPLYAGMLCFFPSSTAEAKANRTHKVKKAAKATELGVSATKPVKVTAASIVKWSKRGDADRDIVAKVEAAGYTVTRRDAKLFKMKRLSPGLIAQLIGEPEPEAVASKAPGKVDLTKPAAIKDIDFDSVAPPEGSPDWVAAKQKNEQKATKLDQSKRQTEDPATKPRTAEDHGPTRKPILPADS